MRCPVCGHVIRVDAAGCPACGATGTDRRLGAPGAAASKAAGCSLFFALSGSLSLVVGSSPASPFELMLLGYPLGWLGGLLGLSLGIVALCQARTSRWSLRSRNVAAAGTIASLAVVLWAIWLSFQFTPDKERNLRNTCQSDLRQLGLGLSQYYQDYDNQYPRANEWCDVLLPYTKSAALFQCPRVQRKRYGYAFNAHMDRLQGSQVAAPECFVGLFDAQAGWNQYGGPELVERRHLGMWNAAFADGHVQWMRESGDALWNPAAPARGRGLAERTE